MIPVHATRLRRVIAVMFASAMALVLVAPRATAQVGTEPPEDIAPVECIFEEGELPDEAVLVICLEIRLLEGEANFGSVGSSFDDPVTIRQNLALAGGLEIVPIEGDGDGAPLSFPSVAIPGGLLGALGIDLGEELTALLDPVNGVSADIQPVGELVQDDPDIAAFLGGEGHLTTASIPLRVQVNNLLLGENCFIGSSDDPIDLNLDLVLSGGYQQPGGGPIETDLQQETGHARLDATDDTFSIPGASGCGVAGVGDLLGGLGLGNPFDQVINDAVGLPSPSGNNLIDFDGWLSVKACSPTEGNCFEE